MIRPTEVAATAQQQNATAATCTFLGALRCASVPLHCVLSVGLQLHPRQSFEQSFGGLKFECVLALFDLEVTAQHLFENFTVCYQHGYVTTNVLVISSCYPQCSAPTSASASSVFGPFTFGSNLPVVACARTHQPASLTCLKSKNKHAEVCQPSAKRMLEIGGEGNQHFDVMFCAIVS